MASIGFRAKTGRAIAVVLCGPADAPRVLRRVEVSLTDPEMPATGQPYHEVMDLPWARAQIDVQKTIRLIEKVAVRALAGLIQQARSENLTICGVGIVGAPERNLEKIGNAHIRAHAAEGVLFRKVLETAARKNRVRHRRFEERTLNEVAASALAYKTTRLEDLLAALGRPVGRPWRADEKMAAAAAWVTLASFAPG